MHRRFLMPQVSKGTGQPILRRAVNNARDDKKSCSWSTTKPIPIDPPVVEMMAVFRDHSYATSRTFTPASIALTCQWCNACGYLGAPFTQRHP